MKNALGSVLPVTGLLACLVLATAGRYPNWWRYRGVIESSRHGVPVQTNDFAAVNAGQLKWLASAAREELDDMLPGGAGPEVAELCDSLAVGGNHWLVNIGHVKQMVGPFYARLDQLGLSHREPWTGTPIDDNDFAPANIGQVKLAFAFDLDTDGDGLPDWWEQTIVNSNPGDDLRSIEDVHADDDPDGDGRNNRTEYKQGTDPMTATISDRSVLVVTTPMREGSRP